MKKIFSLAIMLAAGALSASAQVTDEVLDRRPQTTAPVSGEAIQQGNWLVGAEIGNIGHNFKSETFTLDLAPRAGYFVSDNAVIGASVQLGLSVYDGGESFRYGLTPFVRYYFPEGAAPTHRWFGEAVLGLAGSSEEDSDGDAIFSRVYGVKAGYAHFVASNVALEGTLNLIRSSADIDTGNSSTGLSLGLGLQVYLPGRNN
ncbi:hypothetical protein [Pontibacter akesuensis]|uniref:Outer membrane protein beta-barrel domain-containing protein n=1 Tax=Pontibacter akesuensis TaxID=388950 RepID=A0A1I7FKR6_9BACT|nr:hypothetical protein [Pontibacter akesuensis]GHA61758.1 hypothetical protein GCM10007389_12890 [Pontibacter akesuensis]SFU36636.1 hypothetical protein SAMN04487941_0271 [Pontibacter akesuensis]